MGQFTLTTGLSAAACALLLDPDLQGELAGIGVLSLRLLVAVSVLFCFWRDVSLRDGIRFVCYLVLGVGGVYAVVA